MTNLFMCQKQTDNPKWLKLSTYITDMCTIHSRKQTYIYNWSLQPFRQDYGLASHTTHVVCVKFLYVSGGTYSLTSTPNDIFLRNFFMVVLFTLRVFANNLLRGSRRRNIFHISFLTTDLGYEPRLLRLISRHTTY